MKLLLNSVAFSFALFCFSTAKAENCFSKLAEQASTLMVDYYHLQMPDANVTPQVFAIGGAGSLVTAHFPKDDRGESVNYDQYQIDMRASITWSTDDKSHFGEVRPAIEVRVKEKTCGPLIRVVQLGLIVNNKDLAAKSVLPGFSYPLVDERKGMLIYDNNYLKWVLSLPLFGLHGALQEN